MASHPTDLRIVYTLPWQKGLPQTSLDDEDDWDTLKTQVITHVKFEQSKKNGQGVVKAFMVPIYDLRYVVPAAEKV